MFIKVVFKSILGKLCPEEYSVEAKTPSEAIRAVTNQLKDKLIKPNGLRWVCRVKGYETVDSLKSACEEGTILEIYPDFRASGLFSWVKIAVGVVFVVAGIFFGQSWAVSLGASLILSGIADLLAPGASNGKEEDASRYFGHRQNTTLIGTRIPIAYGRNKIYGHILSLNTQASNVTTYVAPDAPPSSDTVTFRLEITNNVNNYGASWISITAFPTNVNDLVSSDSSFDASNTYIELVVKSGAEITYTLTKAGGKIEYYTINPTEDTTVSIDAVVELNPVVLTLVAGEGVTLFAVTVVGGTYDYIYRDFTISGGEVTVLSGTTVTIEFSLLGEAKTITQVVTSNQTLVVQ